MTTVVKKKHIRKNNLCLSRHTGNEARRLEAAAVQSSDFI